MKNTFHFLKLLSILTLFSLHSFSQTTFKKIYSAGSGSIIYLDSNYYIGDMGENAIINKVNLNGEITNIHLFNSIPYAGGGGSGLNRFFLMDSNNLIFPCSGRDSLYRLCLSSYNTFTGNFNWVTGFNINGNYDYVPVRVNLNGGLNKNYLLSTFKWYSVITHNKKMPLVITTDSSGNLINSYLFNNYFGLPQFTYQIAPDSYITGINYCDSMNLLDSMGATLIRYDSTGSIIWAKTYFTKTSLFHTAIQNNDGTLTLLGNPKTDYSNNTRDLIFLMKVDTGGNVLWCKIFGDSARSFIYDYCKLKATTDGGYMITGGTANSLPNYYSADLILIKTDINGDTLWTRSHGHPFTREIGNDIVQTSDGGYMVTGTSSSGQFPNNFRSLLLFKLDSLGRTSTHCQEFNTPFAVNSIVPYDSNISVTITTGTITAMSSTVNDTIQYIPLQGDGCLLSPVGMQEQTFPAPSKLLAVPNPTLGNFILKNSLSTPPLKTITIYDIFGHELFTKHNVKETEPELDLTKQASGVYYVKVIQGKTVEVTKVVVE